MKNFKQLKQSRIKIDKTLPKDLRDYIYTFNKIEIIRIFNVNYGTNVSVYGIKKGWRILLLPDYELVKEFSDETPVEFMIGYVENALKSIIENRYNQFTELKNKLVEYSPEYYNEYVEKYKNNN